jgi:hypothetical protein
MRYQHTDNTTARDEIGNAVRANRSAPQGIQTKRVFATFVVVFEDIVVDCEYKCPISHRLASAQLKTNGDTSRDHERRRCGKQSDDLCVGNAVDGINGRFLKNLAAARVLQEQNVVGHRTAEIRDEKSVGKYLLISWAIVSAHESNGALFYKILVTWQALAMEE